MRDRDGLLRQKTNLSPEKRALLEKWKRGGYSNQSRKITRRSEEGPAPLSYSQQRMWFLDQLEPGNTAYNILTPFRLSGPLDLSALSFSLNLVTSRHESLRTRFACLDGQPAQIICDEADVEMDIVDLQHLPEPEREQAIKEIASHQRQTPFDLSRGPLMRVKLVKAAQQDHVLLMSLHHIITDGWSMGILMKEVAEAYRAKV